MAITVTNKVSSTNNINNQASFTTSSWTPTANRLAICSFQTQRSAAVPVPTISGNGLTWEQIFTLEYRANNRRLTVWAALTGSSPSAGTITISVSSNCNGFICIVDEIDGADISGTATNAFLQQANLAAGTSNTAPNSFGVTLTNPVTSGNASYGIFARDNSGASTFVPENSFSISNESSNSTPGRLSTDYLIAGVDTITAHYTGSVTATVDVLGLEIKAAGTEFTAMGSPNLSQLTSSSVGEMPYVATGDDAIQQLVGNATGELPQEASGAAAFLNLIALAVGVMPAAITGNDVLAQLTALGAVVEDPDASGDDLLPQLTAIGSTVSGYFGIATATLSQLVALAAAAATESGNGIVGLKNLAVLGTTFQEPGAASAIDLPALTSSGDVVQVPTSSGSASLPNLIAYVRAATDQSNRIHIPLRKRFGVFIHNGWYPYERIGELPSAHNINRADLRMDIANATVDVSIHDPQVSDEIIQHGQILVIESDRYDSFAGPIVLVSQNRKQGVISIQALSWLAILDGRVTPQSEHWVKAVGSGQIVRNLLTIANMRSHTGVYLPNQFEAGPSVTDLQTGGQSVKQALDELHNRTNYEYWLDLNVTPSKIEATLQWGRRQGYDTDIHLYSDLHFTESTYKQDFSKCIQVQVSMGGFGSFLENRTSVATVVQTIPQLPDLGASIQTAGILAQKAIGDMPVGMRTERITLEVMTENQFEIGKVSRKQLERPIAGHESFDLIANNIPDWHLLAPGNTFWYHDNLIGRLSSLWLRVINIQPDEERMEAQLQTELVLT